MNWRRMAGLALAVGLLIPAAAQGQDTRPGIAILSFDNGGSYGLDAQDYDGLQVGLQQMLITELAQSGNLRMVDRGRLNELLREQDLGPRVDANTAARIGRLVGARYVITGGFIDFYGDFRIDARLINVETSEIMKTERVRDKREELLNLVVDLAGQVLNDINLPPLPEEVREARRNREIPAEALTMYSRALYYKDRGLNDRARQLLSRLETEFPELTEATEELRQLGRSS